MTTQELEQALQNQDEHRTFPADSVMQAAFDWECDSCGEEIKMGQAYIRTPQDCWCAGCATGKNKPGRKS